MGALHLSSNRIARASYAGFWKRVVAMLIDSLVLGIVGWLLGLVLGINLTVTLTDPYPRGNLVTLLIGWLYFAGMESSRRQATIGKTVMGIAVTDEAGRKVSFARATGRHFGKILSALLLFIGFIMVAFTRKKQGLHDKMANCLVVERR